jgi:SAM-dependent methyltransferase
LTPLHPEQTEQQAAVANSVIQYYDRLAGQYDEDRFGNSYGRYLDAQERRLLRRWLQPYRDGAILDLACGTGRLLDFATHGLDASRAMVRLAQAKHPRKPIRCARAGELGQFQTVFDAIFCLHLFMHLPPAEIGVLLRACFDHVRAGGVLIFDVPSAVRRRLTGFRPTGWHAGTAFTLREIAALSGPQWRLKTTRGILGFPIHRLPPRIRPLLRPLDDVIGAAPLKPLCSYLVCCLERPQ